jgi:hypothetical protein
MGLTNSYVEPERFVPEDPKIFLQRRWRAPLPPLALIVPREPSIEV